MRALPQIQPMPVSPMGLVLFYAWQRHWHAFPDLEAVASAAVMPLQQGTAIS